MNQAACFLILYFGTFVPIKCLVVVFLYNLASVGDNNREVVAHVPEPMRPFREIATDKIEDHGIPEAALHRLQMQNTMHNIKKVRTLHA